MRPLALPPAETRERGRAPADRHTAFVALPGGELLETQGDLFLPHEVAETPAAVAWAEREAARRERYARDRSAWTEAPVEPASDLREQRAAERAAWMTNHDAKWNARAAEIAVDAAAARAAWLERHETAVKAKEQALRSRMLPCRGARAAGAEKRLARWKVARAALRARLALVRRAWLARHAVALRLREATLNHRKAAARAAWLERHGAKWKRREDKQRAAADRRRAAWVDAHTEPAQPTAETPPDIAADMAKKWRAWKKRRDRLFAPYRPGAFQSEIAAPAPPAALNPHQEVALVSAVCRLLGAFDGKAPAVRPRHRVARQTVFNSFRKRWPWKSKAIPMRPLTRREKAEGESLEYWKKLADRERPRDDRECRTTVRPCPFVSCPRHLFLDVNPKSGSIKWNFPLSPVRKRGESLPIAKLEIDEALYLMPDTCAVDVSEREGITLEEVGERLNVTMERARQVEEMALGKIREKADDDYMYEGPEEEDDDGSAW